MTTIERTIDTKTGQIKVCRDSLGGYFIRNTFGQRVNETNGRNFATAGRAIAVAERMAAWRNNG